MKSSQRRTPDVHARSLLMSGFNAWRMAGPGGFRWLENQVVESYGGPGLLWIAALDPQDTGAVDADERAGSSDLGRVVDDSSLLKGGQRSLVWGAEELATHPTARRRAGAPPST